MSAAIVVPIVAIIVLIALSSAAVKITREYERGVVFRLGRLIRAKGPGVIFLIPIVDRMVRIDLRVVTLDVPRQEMMTRDNVSVTVDAVVYFRVVDPENAIVKVENFGKATFLLAQTTLRSVLGQHELDELLSQRDRINLQLQRVIDEGTEPWGIKVARRGARCRLTGSDETRHGEAGRDGTGAARECHQRRGRVPSGGKTRTRCREDRSATDGITVTLPPGVDRSGDRTNSTIVFPLPIDLLTPFLHKKAEITREG